MPPRGTRAVKGRTRKPWEGQVGHEPHAVWYGERPEKNYRVYLRWRVTTTDGARATNWRWRSLKMTVRDAAGVVDPALAARVQAEALSQHRILSGQESAPKATLGVLTLRDTWPIVSAVDTGSLPVKTPYRDEIESTLLYMRRVLGDDFAWVDLNYEQLQKLVRSKADEVARQDREKRADAEANGREVGTRPRTGLRAAEVVGTRVLTLVGLLRRKHDRIPTHAPIPSGRGWRDDLRRYVAAKHGGDVPEPDRPRHTLDEVRKILRVAASVDPRIDLVLQLGAEYRSGQVVRSMRSHVDLSTGEIEVRGRGKKKGTTVVLTKGQQASLQRALGGYLRQLEAAFQAGEIEDYPLFPAGRLKRGEAYVARHAAAGPIHKRSMTDRFHAVEIAAGVTPIPGRAFYGVRRQLLDAASEEGISDEGMQEHGAWANSRTPRDIYREKQRRKAQLEAATVRARIRGEDDTAEPHEPAPVPPTSS